MQRGGEDAAPRREEITGTDSNKLAGVRVLVPLVMFAIFSAGAAMSERPQESGEESGQPVRSTGVHQRNPGQDSPITD